MKLLFLIPSLQCGGAERVLSLLATELSSRGHTVNIIKFNTEKDQPFFSLDSSVQVHSLGFLNAKIGFPFLISRGILQMRKIARTVNPDIIISFLNGTSNLTLLTLSSLRIPIVVSDHTHPAYYGRWFPLRTYLYRYASAVQVPTETVASIYQVRGIKEVTAIGNTVRVPSSLKTHYDLKPRKIVSLGRLKKEKGFDLLIEAFSRLTVKYPDLQLTIWGEGPEREALAKLIEQKNSRGRVRLPGKVEDVDSCLSEADIFVLPSLVEGFSMVLCEAMAVGLPVVSFDCPSGPGDIITHGKDGMLVPTKDVQALVEAVSKLIENPTECERLGKEAKRIVERFSIQKATNEFEELFERVVSQ